MPAIRDRLPQLDAVPFVMHRLSGHGAAGDAFEHRLALAHRRRIGLLLEVAIPSGADEKASAAALADAARLRLLHCRIGTPVVVSASIEGRAPHEPRISAAEAAAWHGPLVRAVAGTQADMMTADRMSSVQEAIGLMRAGQSAGMPTAVSFATNAAGQLLSGTSLRDAIDELDAATQSAAAYVVADGCDPRAMARHLAPGRWLQRVRGLRIACADGEPREAAETGRAVGHLASRIPNLVLFDVAGAAPEGTLDAVCDALLAIKRPAPAPAAPRPGLVLARRIPAQRPLAGRSRHLSTPLGHA
jgi:hypothetical protein